MEKDNSDKLKLSTEEISFFKDCGYLIVRGVLEREACAKARDMVWGTLPQDVRLKRSNKNTHFGPFKDNEISTDPLHLRHGVKWHVREISTEKSCIDLVYNTNLVSIVEQLLGEGMMEPPIINGEPMGKRGPAWVDGPTDPATGRGIRGFYWTLPDKEKTPQPYHPHTDGHPFFIGMVGLINDVSEDCGPFMVWPKSHRRLYPKFQMQYDQPRIPYYEHMPSLKGIINSEDYQREMEKIQEDTTPVPCHGKEGDVVIWHHRLAHMAGHNYSDEIRQVVLNDFNHKDLDKLRLDPPQENMWRDWSREVQKNNDTYGNKMAKSQGLVR